MMNNRSERGGALVMVMILALVCSIASYAILAACIAQSHHVRFWRERTRARYLAESALVMARERLMLPANLNFVGAFTFDIPVNYGGTRTVRVDVAGVPGGRRTLSARIVY